MDPQLRHALTSGRTPFWIAVSVFLMLNAVGLAFLLTHRDVPFDSTRWKNDEDVRPRMVRDLLENHNLAGKSREVVDTLLGVPRGRDSVRNGTYIYWGWNRWRH